ncbi:MAG: type III-B CRISPR module-associated protein Cmr5 [Chloroflexi bacterium HGW-Chloroflexi-6]|nr:MAG: type III-B CRISPR module-associated protein Cmr5 [Chloroflexi bacterium HGW-Chloroflexi-6]
MQTLEQKYAEQVYSKVQALIRAYPDEKHAARTEYGSMAHKLPVLIRTSGLVQSLAFADSRGKDVSVGQLLQDLAQVIGFENKDLLIQQSREAENQAYIKLTHDSILALTWFKRFAQSILKVEPTDESKGE